MGKDDVFRDGKAEAGASRFAGPSFIDPIETFEQTGQVFRGNAPAKILDIELDAVTGRTSPQNYAAAGAPVLHGIVDQVGEDLVDGLSVSKDHGQAVRGGVPVLRILNV